MLKAIHGKIHAVTLALPTTLSFRTLAFEPKLDLKIGEPKNTI